MEVRSETGIMATREPFNVNLPKPAVQTQPAVAVAMQNMRLAYAPDGTAIYRPVATSSPTPPPSYQAGGVAAGGGGGSAGVVGDGQSPAMPPQGLNINISDPVKKKRGRPRKYGPDGAMAMSPTPVSSASAVGAMVISPTPVSSASAAGVAATVSPVSSGFSPSNLPSPNSADAVKKHRGRPPGSGNKHKLAALGSVGLGFTPHVITVQAGEDVSSKIMSFSQHGPRAVCILSANGAISSVTLRQAATSGGTVTYEGRFEILSLSGSFLLTETGGQRSRTGGMSVSLAGPDGRVLGGGVAGLLTAASPVQVVVGSFIADGKEPKPANPVDQTSHASVKVAPGFVAGASSPPSRGTLSESSGGPGSPMNQSTGTFNNNQQPMSSMPWK